MSDDVWAIQVCQTRLPVTPTGIPRSQVGLDPWPSGSWELLTQFTLCTFQYNQYAIHERWSAQNRTKSQTSTTLHSLPFTSIKLSFNHIQHGNMLNMHHVLYLFYDGIQVLLTGLVTSLCNNERSISPAGGSCQCHLKRIWHFSCILMKGVACHQTDLSVANNGHLCKRYT